VLGAPDALAPHLVTALPDDAVAARTALGLRVLVLARAADPGAGLRDAAGRPALPALEPVGVVALADELRPEVVRTIASFRASGVALKVLSGDDPRTVAALAVRAGLDVGEPVPAPPWTASTTPRWTGSSPAPPCSAGSRPSRRSGSSPRCAAAASTSR
jgi:cation-transporting ATPase E